MANVKKWNAINVQQTAPKFDTAQFSANVEQYNQEQARKREGAAQFASQYWPTTWPYLPEIRQSTAASTNPIKSGNSNSAYQVETISSWGWNNYYFPNGQLTTQWQQNALNGSWHVAWLPQWPQWLIPEQIDYSQFQSVWMYAPEQAPVEQVATPTQQAPKKAIWGTKQPSVSTPQNNVPQVAEENKTSEDYWILPAQQQEKPANNMNEQALADMQADLGWDNTWMLYGKVTADANGGNGIQTIADPYNVERATNEARIANLRKLQAVDSRDIADSIVWWDGTPYGDQAMRDLMQYNPEKYAEVQQYIKQAKWQEAINWITSGNMTWVTTTQLTVENIDKWVDSWADSISSNAQQAWQFITNITNAMTNNWAANSAKQEMLNISSQVEDIKEKLANVKKEAAASFKWDVPQYMVDARAANLAQQYQSQLNKLEGRFNTAADIYKTELSHEQWQAEMDLKRAQFQQNVSDSNWDRYYKTLKLKQDSVSWINGSAYQYDATTWTYKQLSDETAKYSYMSDVNDMITWWTQIYQDWDNYWAQCEAFTDNFVQATTWQRMVWQRSDWATTAEEKRSYVNTLTPEVWSVVVAIWWAYDSQRWHTMLITWYDPTTWIMDLMWANTNWDLKIHTSKTTLADIQRNADIAWIWNPYDTMNKSGNAYGWDTEYSYAFFDTPMASVFESMSSNNMSADQKKAYPVAMSLYNSLYALVNDGSWDTLANSKDIAKIYQDMKNQTFWTAADGWVAFKAALEKSIKNRLSETTSWTQAYNALLKLQKMIETKLRYDSWAAISSSEWMSNFDMLLPQAWESAEVAQSKLGTWNDTIATIFVTASWKPKDYIAIWLAPNKREIR